MTEEKPASIDDEITDALEGIDLQSLDKEQYDRSTSGGAPRAAGGAAEDSKLRRGTVVGISGKDVVVELGPREQGIVSISEFDAPPPVGEVVELAVRGRDGDLLLLSRSEALILASWRDMKVGDVVKARVTGQNTGGLELKIGPNSAFMPASHASLAREEDLSRFLGDDMTCKVLEIDRARNRVVLSRRAVLTEDRDRNRAETTAKLVPGSLVKGTVTRIESFGAFVEISPGVEGLVHVSNLSRKRVENPEDVLSSGQQVEAMVLEIKEGGRRIGLGMKQLEPDPWDDIVHRIAEESLVEGRVVRLMDFGAFVELEPGVEGLLHVSQVDRDRVRHVRDAVKEGETVSVRVLSIDPGARRISLSRLDEQGAVIGSEEAADTSAVREAIDRGQSAPGGTNLGDLFRKALGEGDQ
ncbi:MAG: S1 RNA-binding domain-containing protein [Planctomycetota bacterium]|jgi:ribosomal protein S1|nr:S1 RNA-binding domain-containing protein [Planctomycetota bacterium]